MVANSVIVFLLLILTGCTSTKVVEVPRVVEVQRTDVLAELIQTGNTEITEVKQQLSENTDMLKHLVSLVEKPTSGDVSPEATSPPSETAPLVKLWVTYADDFHCAPCERLKADIEAGKFSEYEVEVVDDGWGPKSYPAVRFNEQKRVIYGYSGVDWLKKGIEKDLKGETVAQPASPVMTQQDLVSLHNQLHGGGNWTWPGDLATHLRATHGVDLGPATTSVRTTSRPVRRTRGIFRTFCPTCP